MSKKRSMLAGSLVAGLAILYLATQLGQIRRAASEPGPNVTPSTDNSTAPQRDASPQAQSPTSRAAAADSTATSAAAIPSIDPELAAAVAAVEPEQPAGHRRMVQTLAEFARTVSLRNQFFGTQPLSDARIAYDALPDGPPPMELFKHRARLAHLELQMGHEAEAIALFDQVYQMLSSLDAQSNQEWVLEALFYAGVAHLRYGETQNCCMRFNADSCLLPIRGGGIHTDQEGSRRAIEFFRMVLERSRKTSTMHLQSLWLINVAYMTVGEYPEGVPAAYRIPPERFATTVEFPRFHNIAKELGLDAFSMSGSVIADDFDNDGHCDLMVSTQEPQGQLELHRNLGNGQFQKVTAQAGLMGIAGGLNMMQADYNNDGFVDVLVLRGAWWGDDGRIPNSLLRNNGNGTFTDVTFDAGLAENNYPTQTAAWADYDLDGDVDLYVGNEILNNGPSPSQLFRNNGDGTFTDVGGQAGVQNFRFVKGVAFGDLDNDRYPDLYISNLHAENRLYHNQGDGTFRDIAESAGVVKPLASFPTWIWDYDNDGNLDIFVAAYDGTIDRVAEYYLFGFTGIGQPRLYRGDGTGRFTDQAQQLGIIEPTAVMGSNFGDVDNDGYLDFYLGTGDPRYYQLIPNKLYVSREGTQFLDVSIPSGLSNLQKGHGIAFADLDHDGDLDIFHQMGGAYLGDKYVDHLFENPGFGRHWMGLRLLGTRSNRRAIGTRIYVKLDATAKPSMIHRVVGSGGSFGASPLEQIIGLGAATRIDRLEVVWPASNTTQVFTDLQVDQVYEITEGESNPRELVRQPFTLGGPRLKSF